MKVIIVESRSTDLYDSYGKDIRQNFEELSQQYESIPKYTLKGKKSPVGKPFDKVELDISNSYSDFGAKSGFKSSIVLDLNKETLTINFFPKKAFDSEGDYYECCEYIDNSVANLAYDLPYTIKRIRNQTK